MSKYDFECQNSKCQNGISNVQIPNSDRVRMSKYDFECQNLMFGTNSNIKIGFLMSNFDIRPKFECQNGISNVKIIFCQSSNVRIGFRI